ncbi:MAG TPA: bifunctional ornithine acetyltransferase/N-acetylglutamate synthase [Kouleothrix sp.]|mgnify:CR=1 FL=1|jgi:glutamate N-acetyltransferase/amino-acid N-acetyltransferase|nr:bifunctional ornithine acetyltransferase/N-acetylglutamate synthase [Kouleothrix sp.]
MSYNLLEDGHVSSPKGFRATGVAGGLKEVRARDLALIYSQHPCRAANIFTTNAIVAAPIFFNQAILSRNREQIRAVLINAGQANAGTGQQGLTDAVECAKLAADELEIPRDGILLMSTGQVGAPLPMHRMKEAVRRAVSELDSGGGRRAALAVLTTDTRPKDRALVLSLREGRSVTLGGLAKGGRIAQPRIANLLAVLSTDAAIETHLLARSLERSTAQSFGRLTFDSAPSPSDGIILLANGAAGNTLITDVNSWEYGAWQEALDALCIDLAQQVLRDAATSSKIVQVHVRGAASEADARQIAQTVARSEAVRWACSQAVPDWGGLLAAVGSSGTELRPDLLELRVGSMMVMLDGAATRIEPATIVQALSGPEIELTVDLHLGAQSTTVWACAMPPE